MDLLSPRGAAIWYTYRPAPRKCEEENIAGFGNLRACIEGVRLRC